jgi:hypothetical protein
MSEKSNRWRDDSDKGQESREIPGNQSSQRRNFRYEVISLFTEAHSVNSECLFCLFKAILPALTRHIPAAYLVIEEIIKEVGFYPIAKGCRNA